MLLKIKKKYTINTIKVYDLGVGIQSVADCHLMFGVVITVLGFHVLTAAQKSNSQHKNNFLHSVISLIFNDDLTGLTVFVKRLTQVKIPPRFRAQSALICKYTS